MTASDDVLGVLVGPSRSRPQRLADRDERIWHDYVNGVSQPALARRYGLSKQRVQQIIARIRAEIPPEDRADRITRHLAALDWIHFELSKIAGGDPLPAYSNGRPVLDSAGRPALDHTQRIRAMAEMRQTIDRVVRLLGLDAPTDVRVSQSLYGQGGDSQFSVVSLVAQARARRAARDQPAQDEPAA